MQKKGSKTGHIIRNVIIALFLCIIVYEAVMIVRDQLEYRVSIDEYDDLKDRYVNDHRDDLVPARPATDEVDIPLFDVDFAALKAVNPDFIGWLYFPALDISYPIVKEQEIDEYLNSTFDGTYNKAGSIFMDVLSSSDFSGMSDMLFGHNMRNGTMFGSLKRIYREDGVLDSDPYVYIYTENGAFAYRVFAYYTTPAGSRSYDEVKTEAEYDDYIEYIMQNSMIAFPSEVSFDGYPPLLTLSTCSGQHGSGMRFVVHTVRE